MGTNSVSGYVRPGVHHAAKMSSFQNDFCMMDSGVIT